MSEKLADLSGSIGQSSKRGKRGICVCSSIEGSSVPLLFLSSQVACWCVEHVPATLLQPSCHSFDLSTTPPPSYKLPSLIPAPQKKFTTPPSLLFSHPHSQKPQKPSTEPHPVNPSCPYPMQEPEHGPPFFDTRMDIFTVEPLDGQRKAHSLSVVFGRSAKCTIRTTEEKPEA